MRWIDADAPPKPPIGVRIALLRQGLVKDPSNRPMRASLASALRQMQRYDEAAAEYEGLIARGDDGFLRHSLALADCQLHSGQTARALERCAATLSQARDEDARRSLQFMRGRALAMLGREAEALGCYRTAIEPGGTGSHATAFAALEALLSAAERDGDGERLLALCDEFPAHAQCTVVRGYRALALSRLGRVDEARSLVDLDRHVLQVRFEPPEDFGGLEAFNAQLAAEIQGSAGLIRRSPYGFLRTEDLGAMRERAFAALARFLRLAIDRFIAEWPTRGLDAVMPGAPAAGHLYAAGNVVFGDEGNRAHLHKFAYVSGVYHVAVPADAASSDPHAGDLVLGRDTDIADGSRDRPGRRYIAPKAGVATIFPSHVFHAVVPTHSQSPRIAVPFDLMSELN